MIFTSGTQERQRRTVNHDPLPYVVNSIDVGEFRTNGNYVGYRNTYRPRQEFAVKDNPILERLRGEHQIWLAWKDRVDIGEQNLAWRAQSLLDDLNHDWRADFTDEEIAHAKRVLARLAGGRGHKG